MSASMIMRKWEGASAAPKKTGVGDLVSDTANAVLTPLTQQMNAKIETEVAKAKDQVIVYALVGGFIAGLVGVYVGTKLR